jgi:hypothetical protein
MSRPSTLPSPWSELATAFGGVQALARACGVQRSAVYRWACRGIVPGLHTRQHVNALARARKIAEPFSEEET